MSLQDTVVNSGDRAIESALDRSESDRQERWAADREDKQSLRDALERPVADLDFPKQKRSLDADDGPNDRMQPFAGLRENIETALEESHVASGREEQRQKNIEKFELLSKQIKRAHGIEGADAIESLWNAEKALRRDPEGAIRYLADQYYLNRSVAANAEQREQTNTLNEVHRFFDKYDVSEAVGDMMGQYMSSPQFQRTGDHERDMLRAVADIKRGLGKVRAG